MYKESLVLERLQVFKGFLNDSVSTSVPGTLKEKQITKIHDLEMFYWSLNPNIQDSLYRFVTVSQSLGAAFPVTALLAL